MWWQSDRADEIAVAQALDRLEQFVDAHVFIGWGMAYQTGQRVPLLLVDEHRDTRPELWVSGEGPLRSLIRRWLRRRDVGLPPWVRLVETERVNARSVGDASDGSDGELWVTDDQRPHSLVGVLRALAVELRARDAAGSSDLITRGLAVPLLLADAETQRLAQLAELPECTLVSYWPRPKFTTGRLRGPARRPYASAGFHIECHGTQFLATAGHLEVAPAAPVYRSRRWSLRSRGELLGTMHTRVDPHQPFDWQSGATRDERIDLGLVELSTRSLSRRSMAAITPPGVSDFDDCRWHGAGSGPMGGEVVGPLRTIVVEGLPLAHCWFLSNDCRDGDSGAAVEHLPTGQLLGQVVGARGAIRKTGGRTGTIVQDADTLITTVAMILSCAPAQLSLSVLDPP